MADDNDIRLHCRQITSRVNKGFSFFQTAGGSGNVEGVCAHALGGNFEGEARAGARFKKKINNGSSSESGNLLDLTGRNFFERGG